MSDDKLFEQALVNPDQRTACSPPAPGIAWRGVAIRAPAQVALPGKQGEPAKLVIPLCGLYSVDVAAAIRHPGPKLLVIKDDNTGVIYRAAIVTQDSHPTIPPPRSPRPGPAAYANQAFGSYFNVNVAEYVSLPTEPARYHIKVEYAGHQSNQVEVAVIDHL